MHFCIHINRSVQCPLKLMSFFSTILSNFTKHSLILGEKKILPKKATRNVTLAALLIEEVTKRLANE